MTAAFTTRAESEASAGLNPADLERMAERAYEAGKHTGSHLPRWAEAEENYRAAIRREIAAAVRCGVEIGCLILKEPKR